MFPIVEETIYVAQICMYFFLKMTTVQQRVNNIILETEKVEWKITDEKRKLVKKK